MTKIRIYELAKELGVDNKEVLAKAQELGMVDKKSHSNALDDDEVRRIKKAIAQANADTNEVAHATVVTTTTRVDKITGKEDTIVEKRSGNIIRRRKRVDTPEVATPAQAEVQTQAKEETPAIKEEKEAFPLSEEKPTESQNEEKLSSDVSKDAQASDEETKEEVSKIEEEAVEEQAKDALKENTAKDTKKAEEEAKKQEEKKSKNGPKILGKIELSQFVAPASKEKTGEAGKYSNKKNKKDNNQQINDDGKEGGKKFDKKRSKKKEFSQHELVDYEGGPSRKPRGFKVKNKGGVEDKEEEAKKTEITQPKASKMVVKIDEVITVGELARQMSVKAGEVIGKLISLGVMATINQTIDLDTATLIADEFGYQVESVAFDEESLLTKIESDEKNLKLRPPVVTVMGHVDHGKTSLLDKIRNSSVVDKEHGGITQHIGAYSVKTGNNKVVTFIDTPGHAAFTQMRARGAQITDIVILVVAADDGVMPQTVEAINHSKSAGVTIIVAINKMDKPTANPDRIKQQLSEYGLQPEEWGGDIMFYPISALTGAGIDELLEGVALQAEMLELKADPTIRAKGVIIEAKQALGRGTVATVLIQEGTLNKQDIFVCGSETGRVRSMLDHKGQVVSKATPAMPVEITGFSGVPEAGDELIVVESESTARQIADYRIQKKKAKEELNDRPMTLEEFSKRAGKDAILELNVILKADVHGSVEAVKSSLEKLSTQKVKVNVIHSAVGGVNESDVQLAMASNAIIVGFNVRGEARALANAESNNIETRFYRIIYELIDDVKLAMVGLLAPDKKEEILGSVDVRDTFQVPKVGTIAGSYVKTGTVKRGALVRVLRDHVIIHEGKISSLRRQKDDVKEVQTGYECGIGVENYNDIKIGDEFEIYQLIDVTPSLE